MSSLLRRLAVVGVTSAAATLTIGFMFPVWAAAPPGPGSAVIVIGGGSSSHRNSGGSATPFSFALPRGAACPGDSANGGYRVQGFMVPVAVDPATLRYKSIAPAGAGLLGLFDTYTHSYAQEQTANADHPGGPGPIINIPTFDFKVLAPGQVAAGGYHIGVACSLINQTVRYWSVDIVVTLSAADHPAGFTWRVANPPPDTSHLLSTGRIAFAFGALAIVIAVVLVVRRRRVS